MQVSFQLLNIWKTAIEEFSTMDGSIFHWVSFESDVFFIKLRCDTRFQLAFAVLGCVFREIMLVGSNKSNYFENATFCNKRTLKMRVAMQLEN